MQPKEKVIAVRHPPGVNLSLSVSRKRESMLPILQTKSENAQTGDAPSAEVEERQAEVVCVCVCVCVCAVAPPSSHPPRLPGEEAHRVPEAARAARPSHFLRSGTV